MKVIKYFSSFFFLTAIFFAASVIDVSAATTGTLRPTADGGDDSASWLNDGGTACNTTDCYLQVIETSGSSCTNSDGDTSYIRSNGVNISQTFDLDESSIPDGSTVTQIAITLCAKRHGSAISAIQARQCVNGSCIDSGTNIITTNNYAETTQIFLVNFTKGAATDIEIGATDIDPARNSRISQISGVITYTPPDTTPPSAVSDLALFSPSNSAITLTWTSPGDDANSGTAASYDIRYSTSNITAGNFSSATAIAGAPTPLVAGTSQSTTVTGLSPSTTYFFAMKTSDEVPNTSAISNVPSLATTAIPDTTAPAAITDLSLSNPTSSSIDLVWTSPGDDGSTGSATSYDIRYSTSAITAGNFSGASVVSGVPTPQIAGTSQSMTVSGLLADTTYFFAMKASDEVPNTSAISNVPSLATLASGGGTSPPASGGGSSGGVSPTKIHFSGQAYPAGTVEIFRKGSLDQLYTNVPITNSTINEDGSFTIEYISFLQGEYFFALRAKDKNGRESGFIPFAANLISSNEFAATDILFPPTVGFEKLVATKGSEMLVEGYAAASAKVEYEIDNILLKSIDAGTSGSYSFKIPTINLKLGDHYLRVRQILPGGRKSDYSFAKTFRISLLAFPKADFNGDNAVTIIDWSIFLSRWAGNDPALRVKIDMDGNGIVDIADFSIFLKAMKLE